MASKATEIDISTLPVPGDPARDGAMEALPVPDEPQGPTFADKLGAMLFTRGRSVPGAAGAMMKAREAVQPALRYMSGLVDTGAAAIGKPIVQTAQKGLPKSLADAEKYLLPNDVITDAVKGRPRPASVLWDKYVGAPAGPSFSDIPGVGGFVDRNGPNDPTLRGTLAELSSLALDPANRAAKVIRPVAAAAGGAGRALYRNSLRAIDAEPLAFKGVQNRDPHAFADLAYDDKIFSSGNPRKMLQQLEDYLKNKLGKAYNAIIDDPAVAAKTAHLDDTLNRTIPEAMDRMGHSSYGEEGVTAFNDRLGADKALDAARFPEGRNPRQLLQRAKDYSDAARGKIGAQGDIMKVGAREAPTKELLMTFAQDQRQKAADLAEEAFTEGNTPSIGPYIRELNRKYSLAKPAKDVLQRAAKIDERKAPITQVDGMIAGLMQPAVMAAKHGVKYLNSMGGVAAGNTLRSMSEQTLWDNLLRRALGTTQNE